MSFLRKRIRDEMTIENVRNADNGSIKNEEKLMRGGID